MIVLDASAAVELLLGLPLGAAVAERIADSAVGLHAPQLLSIEVAQVVRRYRLRGDIDDAGGAAALDDLAQLGIEYHDHDIVLARVWELRSSLTAYDAAYVALAELLAAPVLTGDSRLAGSSGHEAVIELLH